MKYFTIDELCRTSHNVENQPTNDVIQHLVELSNTLDSIRALYGKPINVTSGYRSIKLNKLVGGASNSVHCIGYAADTKSDDMPNYQACVLDWAKNNNFDQIIIEYPHNHVGSWIHIGIKNNKGEQRKQLVYTNDGKKYPSITTEFYDI